MDFLKETPDKVSVNVLSDSEAIILDAGNYYPSRDGQIADIEGGLADSEWVAKVLSVAGNDKEQKKTMMKLIGEIGFDTIDGGRLSESWRQQPG